MSLLPRPGGKVPPSGSKKSSGGSPSNGWVDGGNVADSRRIPPYDATKDKHGGLAPKISYNSSSLPELEVLKAIILREDYLTRLLDMSKRESQYTLVGSMANTLDLIRLTTVEVVEAIAAWRKLQPKHMPFKWNGVNYLLKVPSDLDFMQECDVMVRWLGFSLDRNPFVMPDNLDTRGQVFEPRRPGTPTTSSIDDPFLSVGGLPVAAAPVHPMSPTTAAGRTAKTAYETRVLNDEDLVPRPKPAGFQASRPPTTKAKTTVVLPSQIGDLDVLRIREAEKSLLEEEALFGRFKRDLYGRLVPEAVALQQAKTASIQQTHVTAGVVSSATPGEGGATSSTATTALRLTVIIQYPYSRIRMPMMRSRGAKMEEELEKTIVANKNLENHIAGLRDAIAKQQQSVTIVAEPSDSPMLPSGTMDSPTIAMLRRDLDTQVVEFERKKREIYRKQEAMEAFKAAQKSAVENARVAELLRKKQMDEAQVIAEKVKLVQIYKATHIQKIVRGILARREYKVIRIKYTIASTYIEALARGFLARRRVFKAAVVIQKTYRGRLGRQRMSNFRALHNAKLRLIYLTEHLCTDELVEMGRLLCAYAKHPESKYTVKPSHVVLGLIRILKSTWGSCLSPKDKRKHDQPIHEVRWMEGGQFLRRAAALLRALHTLATSAGRMLLPLSSETLALIQAYRNDSHFTLPHFATQGALAKTSSTLFQWIQALATISDVQHVFLSPTPVLELNLEDYADEDRAESIAVWHFSLLFDCYAKHLLVQTIMATFPGLFLRINTPNAMHIQTIQQTFDAGYRRLSRRLLATPELFADKLQAVNMTCLPVDNIMVLKEYVRALTCQSSSICLIHVFTH
ncbi:hypothetical protein DYB38_003391 [Aphanomyces astaci]|uniref:Uncharacterized protein n=1 Tax=Aphanomyces astaci TaxID=112090 RepID=A0A397DNS5_APHAT|nr:hypothetical protein DYB38_003391 [Aphanomyces astaci]